MSRYFLRKGVAALAVLGMFAITASTAEAVATLRLTQGVNVETIADGDADDSLALADGVTWIGSLGVFSVNVSTGLANPATPFPEILHLNSVNTSTGAGTLTIEFSQTGYNYLNPPFLNLLSVFAPFIPAGATLSYQAYYDTTNTLFGQGTAIGVPLTAAGSTFGPAPLVGPYSVTQIVTITHAQAQTSSFDASVSVVPEPASLTLFGLGLAGVSILSRRRRAAR